MQIVRTILWVLLFAGLMFFSIFNWKPVEVQIWSNMVLETKVPALVISSFLLGMIPTWLLHRGTKWRLARRIKTLETAVSVPQVAPPVSADYAPTGTPETVVTQEPLAPATPSYAPKNPL